MKDAALIEALGTVDELDAHIGLLVALLNEKAAAAANADEDGTTGAAAEAAAHADFLMSVQRDLFDAGAVLAAAKGAARPTAADVARLEKETDRLCARKQERRFAFVLPGGSVAAAEAHVARTVCRRAERRLVTAAAEALWPYFNRLSDYLYALSGVI